MRFTPPRANDAQAVPHICCGRRMLLRWNRDTGEGFMGCANYPRCRRTVPLVEPDESAAPALAAKLSGTDWAAMPYGTLRRVAAIVEGGAK